MLRGMERWLPGYIASVLRRRPVRGPCHLLFCTADHFEPFARTLPRVDGIVGRRSAAEAREEVRAWCRACADTTGGLRDADGRPPRHTFFYPWDEYDPECLETLRAFCAQGHGEVEMHLHHRGDTECDLHATLAHARDTYASTHGLLGRDAAGTPRYAFVHGNWALCNARPDGDWCGVEREIKVLAQTGCYADFTFPSAPSPTQPRRVNSIHYARDPASGERGAQYVRAVRVDRPVTGTEGLLCVQGPLGLNWRWRKMGVMPRLENGELSAANPPSAGRLALWRRLQVHVAGRPDWIVVKLHTHGMSARSRAGVLGPAVRAFHQILSAGDGGWRLHYVTARELYNIIKAAEAGGAGDPCRYRDDGIAPPPFSPSEGVWKR